MDRKAQKGAQEAGQEDVVIILPASNWCEGAQNSDINQLLKDTEKGGEGEGGWRKEKKEKRNREDGRDQGQNCEYATGAFG